MNSWKIMVITEAQVVQFVGDDGLVENPNSAAWFTWSDAYVALGGLNIPGIVQIRLISKGFAW